MQQQPPADKPSQSPPLSQPAQPQAPPAQPTSLPATQTTGNQLPDTASMLQALQSGSSVGTPQGSAPLPKAPTVKKPQANAMTITDTAPELGPESEFVPVLNLAARYFPKFIGVLLTFQGLFGIYKSLQFIMIEFPMLEDALARHTITQERVNSIAASAAITTISTVLSMFFAMRLTILKNKTAKKLNTVAGVVLFFSNAFLHDYFAQFNSGDFLANSFINLDVLFHAWKVQLIQMIPFLQYDAATDSTRFVWYK